MLGALRDNVGLARAVWGSDWPWTQHEQGRCYRETLTWWAGLVSTEQRRAILAGNPRRLLGWPPE